MLGQYHRRKAISKDASGNGWLTQRSISVLLIRLRRRFWTWRFFCGRAMPALDSYFARSPGGGSCGTLLPLYLMLILAFGTYCNNLPGAMSQRSRRNSRRRWMKASRREPVVVNYSIGGLLSYATDRRLGKRTRAHCRTWWCLLLGNDTNFVRYRGLRELYVGALAAGR